MGRAALLRDGKLDRIDAEFVAGHGVAVERCIRASGGLPLSYRADLSEERVSDPKAWSPARTFRYVDIGRIDLTDGFVIPAAVVSTEAPSRARMEVAEGMVGLSSVRPNRNQVFLVNEDLDGAVASTGFVMLKAKDPADAPMLFAALKTKAAVAQLERLARASMYPTLYPPDVLGVVLPKVALPTKTAVTKLLDQAFDARKKFLEAAVLLTEEATRYFDSLGGSKLESGLRTHKPVYRSKKALLDSSGRFDRIDAEYHAAAFEEAFRTMGRRCAVETMRSVAPKAWRGKSFTAADTQPEDAGGPAVIKVGLLSRYGIQWGGIEFANDKPPARPGEAVRDGDVLFNAAAHEPSYIAHRVDVVSDVPTNLTDRLLPTTHLMAVRIADQEAIPPQYLARFLSHPLGYLQVRRSIRGVRAEVYADDVLDHVQVPIAPEKVMIAISQVAHDVETWRLKYKEAVVEAVGVLEAATGEKSPE